MGSCFSGVLLPICHAHAASTWCDFPGRVSAVVSMAFSHGGLTVTFMDAKCSGDSLLSLCQLWAKIFHHSVSCTARKYESVAVWHQRACCLLVASRQLLHIILSLC